MAWAVLAQRLSDELTAQLTANSHNSDQQCIEKHVATMVASMQVGSSSGHVVNLFLFQAKEPRVWLPLPWDEAGGGAAQGCCRLYLLRPDDGLRLIYSASNERLRLRHIDGHLVF